MKAIIFPGQGSQKAGMATEFENNFQIVKDIFARADESLKFSLSKIILNGSDADLKKTEITQPAILVTSFAIFSVLKNEFNFNLSNVKYMAGHSLGEYSALVASSSLSIEEAVSLVHERGKLMQAAVPEGKGAMLAVMGLDINELNTLLNNFDLFALSIVYLIIGFPLKSIKFLFFILLDPPLAGIIASLFNFNILI